MSKPVFALCGSSHMNPEGRYYLPPYGSISAREWSPEPLEPGGFRGLPWGIGDPAAAFLDDFEWAVVRVDDPDGPIIIPADAGVENVVAAVKFRSGTVIYSGDRRGALETLLQCGADRSQMSVKLALPGENGVADVGPYGVAIGGQGGMARGAERSHVFVDQGYGGVAVAGRYGHASARCDHGIAVVGAHGEAYAGIDGLAAAREVGGRLEADQHGIALSVETARGLFVGAWGVALAMKNARSVSAGPRGIVVVREAVPNETRVSLGEGAIAVLRFAHRGGGASHFAIMQGGYGGIEPDAWHVWADGRFSKLIEPRRESDDSIEPDQLDGAGTVPQSNHDQKRARNWLKLDGPLANDVIVLCDAYRVGNREIETGAWLEAKVWDPAPEAREGLFGLAWGIGTRELGAQYVGRGDWLLVRARDVVPVPVAGGPSAGLVKFARGRVVYRGNPKGALDILARRGVDPSQLAARIKSGGPGTIVRASDLDVAAAAAAGWAIADFYAEAGPDGLARGCWAVAGERGIAIDDWRAKAGRKGIAVCDNKRHGYAEAGEQGAAMALGERYASVFGTAAIFLGFSGDVAAGDDGVAIGGASSSVRTGRDGIAIALGGIPKGEPGALLLSRTDGGFRTAIVGEDGVETEFGDFTNGGKAISIPRARGT